MFLGRVGRGVVGGKLLTQREQNEEHDEARGRSGYRVLRRIRQTGADSRNNWSVSGFCVLQTEGMENLLDLHLVREEG